MGEVLAMSEVPDDVERLFERLVEVLAGHAPHLLDDTISVSDLYERIVPYRTHRSSLGFDTNQDYEMALLRLLAGEHGLAELEQEDARQALGMEARSVNPNPGAFRAYGAARVRLNPAAADAIRLRREAFAPPLDAQDPAAQPVTGPTRQLPFELDQANPALAGNACPHCDQSLPQGRVVAFCPFCGGNVTTRACPQCGTALETAWRHCITCGHRVK
jgi:hypothetical protein